MATYSIEEILNAVYSGTTLSGTASAEEVLNTVFNGTDALQISGTGSVPDSTAAGQLLQGDGADGWEITTELTGITINDVSNDVHARVVHGFGRNVTGSQIDAGTPVYVSGYNIGAEIYEMTPADASDPSKMPAIGLAEDDIPNGSNGMVVQVGVIESIDTSSWSVGDSLYVAAGGGLTSTKPTGANGIQKVAQVIRSNVATGALTVFGAGRVNDVPNLSENNIWIGNASGVPTEMGFAPSTAAGTFAIGDGDNGWADGGSGLTYVGGKLGIGTNAPDIRFEVHDDTAEIARFKTTSSTAGLITFYDANTATPPVIGAYNSDFSILTNGSRRLTVLESGDVGINHSAPTEKITVVGNILLGKDPITDAATVGYEIRGPNALPAATTNLEGGDLTDRAGKGSTGTAGAGHGGDRNIYGGDGYGTGDGGSINISGGTPNGTGNYGDVNLAPDGGDVVVGSGATLYLDGVDTAARIGGAYPEFLSPQAEEDVGITWSDLGQRASETYIYSIAYAGNGIVLAGSVPTGKIFRSTDYGATWSDLGQQGSETHIHSFAYVGNGIVLAGSGGSGKIFRSTDYGTTWSDLGQQASETYIYALTYVGNGIVLAGSYPNGKIFRSTNHGETWSDLGQQASETNIFSLTYAGDGIVLAGSGGTGKIFRSTDYGATWSDLGQQASETQIRSLTYVGAGTVLAGSGGTGKIFRSTDYGATWSDLGQQASETYIFSIAYAGNGIVLAGSRPTGKIFRSTDYGATWSDLGQQGSETYILSIAYAGNGIVLAGSYPNGKIFRSKF